LSGCAIAHLHNHCVSIGQALGEGGSIFLQDSLERGMSFGKVAGFLRGTEDEVREKAKAELPGARNIAIEYWWAGERAERFTEIANEVVGLRVDVIVTRTLLPAAAGFSAIPTTCSPVRASPGNLR
jgi:hypothetical protein